MRNKLFAMEQIEEELDVVELEASAEEGEVADVQVEIEEEVSEVALQEAAVADGIGAADQLEEIEDVVEASIEEGEGLDPIAAEAIRIAVEAVCARVGASPKSMYALYATENFESASSRKANTRFALESVSDFLKNLWDKIKAAVSNIWQKVVEFWNKHLSSLNRVLKALESMKARVSSTKGAPQLTDKDVKASGGLIATFPGTGDLTVASVTAFVNTHKDLDRKGGDAMLDKVNANNPAAMLTNISGMKDVKFTYGSESAPLAGGVHFEVEMEVENAKVADEDKIEVKLLVQEERVTGDKERDLIVADKAKLKALIESTIAVIKATIKGRDDVTKAKAKFDKAVKDTTKAINAIDTSDDNARKAARKQAQALRAFSTINSKIPSVNAKLAAADVRLAKGVLTFANASLAQYK